jgi:hypothetical protein
MPAEAYLWEKEYVKKESFVSLPLLKLAPPFLHDN